MSIIKRVLLLTLALSLAACGGGGNDAGTSSFGSGGGTSPGGSTGTGGLSVLSYGTTVDIQRAGTSTTQITSTETVQAVATVTSSAGAPVEGVVVVFTQSQGSLLAFAPAAATALTNASGKASIDITAADPTKLGAVSVTASATIGAAAATPATRAIQINAGALTPGVPVVPAAINFVSSSPSGTAIVIKGAGGNGRSESAILSFRVVDASNAPVNGAVVNFALNSSNGGAVLAQSQGTSNSDGLVSVTVSSGTLPASIIVTARAASGSATSQSDTLLVSNSVPVEGSFEIVAAKYNLDGRKTGDSTTVTAYVADANGNPVPDGVAVSFQTDAGAVASSTLGGCLTVNGICSVQFRVQEPRATGVATVVATVRVGAATTLVDVIRINMAGATSSGYLAIDPTSSVPATKLTLSTCKQSFELLLTDGAGRSVAADTAIGTSFLSSNVVVAVGSGTPVLDQLDGAFSPTSFGFEVDLTSTSLAPLCRPGGVVSDSSLYFRLSYTTPGGIVFSQRVELAYPQ